MNQIASKLSDFSDTIVAISTASGMGAIAGIRVSGSQSFSIVDALFFASNGKVLSEQINQRLCFGELRLGTRIIDQVLVAGFQSPHSYTGEDMVEISCHGSPYIQQEIVKLLLETGCRLAGPGEFTRRAFFNGKMDLSQAEAVADLIASSSEGSHRLAMNQMKGHFSRQLMHLRSELLNFVSLIELELDFAEEDVEFANRDQLKSTVTKIEAVIASLSDSFSTGKAIKNGIPVAIVGETNAGKSTLLNYLLKDDRAIVSDIHGTTRDVIEDVISIDGQLFRFIDTAGIRNTSDVIENMGIDRTFQKLDQANIVIWVVDAGGSLDQLQLTATKILPRLNGQKLMVLFNKVDILETKLRDRQVSELTKWLQSNGLDSFLFLSIKTGEQLDRLEPLLCSLANLPKVGENDVIVTNMRHYEALQNALTAIRRVSQGLDNGISGDFLSQDIRECMRHIGEITGQISTDEILGNIFGKFCIGK